MTTSIRAVKEGQRDCQVLEHYKHLVDQSAIVCKFDLSGRITYVNDTLCKISGHTREELIGLEITDLRHAIEPDERHQELLAATTSGKKWTGIVKNRKKNGECYVVESNLVPILDEHGVVTEIVSLDVDVTPLHETYENLVGALSRTQLPLAEQRHFVGVYQRALELGTCICVTDRSLRIVSINATFENLLGFRSDELEGKPISQIMPDLSDERFLNEVQQTNKEHVTNRIARFVGRDEKELQFSVGFVGVHNLAGDVESIIMICQDITQSLRLSREIVDTQRELLYVLGDVVESRSQETGKHVQRVAQISRFLALKAGLDADTAEMIETAAPMHDVGKVGIRNAVLQKPGRLSMDEFEEMKEHASIGFSILGKENRALIGLAATIAHQHHERHDGQGYPAGLKGDEIRIEARIVGVADVLDALLSARIYKPAWDEQSAFDYFCEQRGQQFDPELVDLVLEHWDAIMALRKNSTIA